MSNSSFGRKWASDGRNGLGNTALSGEIVRAVLISDFDQNVRQIYAKLLVCQALCAVFFVIFHCVMRRAYAGGLRLGHAVGINKKDCHTIAV